MQTLHRLVFPLLLVTSARAWAGTVEEVRQVPAFDGVHVGSGIKARVEGGAPRVVLTGDAAALRLVRTVVRDGTLIVELDRDVAERPKGEIRATVRMPVAQSLGASGGAVLEATVPTGASLAVSASGGSRLLLRSPVRAESLALAASGSSTVALDSVETRAVAISLSGSSRISLSGRGGEAEVAAAGASELAAERLQVADLAVHASGGSVATIRVSSSVEGALAGGSRVRVPAGVKANVLTSGGSTLEQDL